MRTRNVLIMNMIFGLGLVCGGTVSGETFEPISSISSSTSGTDLFPALNLIQGPGVGFDASAPHDSIDGGATGSWVTDSPGGFPSDYIAVAGTPVLTFDLGADTDLDEISVWGYSDANANGVSEISLRFATEADGPAGFGTSITFNPTFLPINDQTVRQIFPFGQVVLARYVEVTAVDNFFVFPGDGSGGQLPGGNRVGLSEIAFRVAVIPVELERFVID